MDLNFLQTLFGSSGPGYAPVSAPRPPSLAPGRLSGLAEALQGLGDDGIPSPISAQPANIMQGVVAPEMPQRRLGDIEDDLRDTPNPRQRRSLLETVGRLSDVLARVGDRDPLYQPTLDAREDRTRAIDMQGLQRTLATQQIDEGEDEATGRGNVLLGQAVRGLQAIQARGGDIGVAWPILAQQAGIPPERVTELGQIFASDPNALAGFAAMLQNPQQQGSASTAIQNYAAYQRILAEQGPEAAQRFLAMAQPASEIQPYQAAQLRESAADRASREALAAEARATRERIAREVREARTGNGTDLTPTQRGAVRQVRESVPAIRTTLARVEELSRNLGTTSGPVGGRVPGQLAGGSSAQFDRAQALLAAQIRGLIRVAGEGAMSDYESRLNVATLPARTDSPSGRSEAIRGLRSLLSEVEARAGRLLTPAPRAAAPRRPAARPAARPNSGGGRIVSVNGPDEARRLAPGTRFRTPDGRVLVRQ